jgi:hypothetical protein
MAAGPLMTQLGHGMNGKAVNSGVKVRIYLISMCELAMETAWLLA